jgi:glycosyltransferase involved in cell wall biosynthesis
MKNTNIVLFSRSLVGGGAARAAGRWVDALDCQFVIENQKTIKFKVSKLAKFVERKIISNFDLGAYGPTSLSLFSSLQKKDIVKSQARYYFIHWVQSNFMSIFLLSSIAKRSIFYAHDEWLLTNMGHYQAYYNATTKSKVFDYLQDYKCKQVLGKCMAVVTPSIWLEAKFQKLDLNLRTAVIPNPMPDLFLEPINFIELRRNYGISLDAKIVLLISDSNIQDPRKGILDAIEMIQILQRDLDDLIVFFVGRSNSTFLDGVVNLVDFGYVNSDQKLREIYGIANCTLIPSLIDNFPQTSTESQATGTPVVVYDSGGSPETVLIPDISGKIVPFRDSKAYLDAVKYFLELPIEFQLTQRKIIQFEAKAQWSNGVVANKLLNFLSKL